MWDEPRVVLCVWRWSGGMGVKHTPQRLPVHCGSVSCPALLCAGSASACGAVRRLLALLLLLLLLSWLLSLRWLRLDRWLMLAVVLAWALTMRRDSTAAWTVCDERVATGRCAASAPSRWGVAEIATLPLLPPLTPVPWPLPPCIPPPFPPPFPLPPPLPPIAPVDALSAPASGRDRLASLSASSACSLRLAVLLRFDLTSRDALVAELTSPRRGSLGEGKKG